MATLMQSFQTKLDQMVTNNVNLNEKMIGIMETMKNQLYSIAGLLKNVSEHLDLVSRQQVQLQQSPVINKENLEMK